MGVATMGVATFSVVTIGSTEAVPLTRAGFAQLVEAPMRQRPRKASSTRR